MYAHPEITSFGQYKKTWVWEDRKESDPRSPQTLQRGLPRVLKRNFLADFLIHDSVLSSWKPEKSALNSFIIERSLRALQSYLGFEFPHPREVVEYLLSHPGLYDIVLDTCYSTKEVFGHNSQISLELYRDPEIHDEYLTIFIRQESYEPDIIEKIEGICREYEKELVGESGYLLVNTDFHPPMV